MTALRTESRAEWMRLPMVAGAKVQIGLRPVQRCKGRVGAVSGWEHIKGKSPIQVTGDGHLGIGHSGVGVSAIGYRL